MLPQWNSCVFLENWNIFCSFSVTRFPPMDAFNPTILLWETCIVFYWFLTSVVQEELWYNFDIKFMYVKNTLCQCVISGSRLEVDGICALLRYCLAYSRNSIRTFRDNLSVHSSRVKKAHQNAEGLFLDFLTREDGTDRLCWNVNDESPLHAS
jgi:hypothetical protein